MDPNINEQLSAAAKRFRIVLLPVVAAALIAVAVMASMFTVDEGERAVVLTFGEISRVCDPGLHFRMPFIQDVRYFSVRVHKTTFDRLTAYSYDQQIVESFKISATWNYDPTKIAEIYTRFGTEGAESSGGVFATVVAPKVQEISKIIFGQFTAQTAIQERAKLNQALSEQLNDALREYPIQVLSIQLEDVNFSDSYEAIVEQTAQAKQSIEKQRNELTRVDLEAQQKVKQAESENKAMKLRADAEAYQIEVKAKAEAEAIRLRGEALKQNPRLVELSIAEKWNGSVPDILMTGEGGENILPMLNINKAIKGQ